MKKSILALLLVIGCLTDCPLNNYPRQTVVGFIQANIDNDPSLHNKTKEYIYPLNDPLPPKPISVAIGIVGLELNPNQKINFQISHFPTSSYDQLHFGVYLEDSRYGWKYIKFSFLASQSSLFLIHMETDLEKFSTGNEAGSYSIYRPLSGFNSFQNQPVIRVYLSGLNAIANPVSTEEIQAMQKQLESMRLFSRNSNLIKLIEQAIQIKKSINFKIQKVKILGKIVGFNIQTNMELKKLSFSYVLFSDLVLRQNHNTIIGDFTLVDGKQHKFTTLNNMGMILAGLTKFTLPRNSNYNFDLAFDQFLGQGYFSVLANLKYLELGFVFFAVEIKINKVCEDCPDSPTIYENKFCVSACPRGFSRIKRLSNYYCDKCEIQKLKIVSSTGDCVCAKRHYLEINEDICQPCSYDCYSCSEANRCLTCDNDMLQTKRFMNMAGGCQCPPIGYYDDVAAEDIVCRVCDSGCRTCEGARAHDCLTCTSGKELDNHGFCVCSKGFSQNLDGSCSCYPPNQITGAGFCIRTDINCSLNQVPQFVDITRRCVCTAGFIQVLNDCIKCPQNSVFNADQLNCDCLNKTILINGICAPCGINQVYDEITGICRCSGSTFKADNGACIKCPAKMAYINEKCECIFNYFEISPGICQRCIKDTDGPKCRKNYENF